MVIAVLAEVMCGILANSFGPIFADGMQKLFVRIACLKDFCPCTASPLTGSFPLARAATSSDRMIPPHAIAAIIRAHELNLTAALPVFGLLNSFVEREILVPFALYYLLSRCVYGKHTIGAKRKVG
jgi:hypothetical protein